MSGTGAGSDAPDAAMASNSSPTKQGNAKVDADAKSKELNQNEQQQLQLDDNKRPSNDGGKRNDRHSSRKRKKTDKVNEAQAKHDDNSTKDRHPGSFAVAEQRELFQISIPDSNVNYRAAATPDAAPTATDAAEELDIAAATAASANDTAPTEAIVTSKKKVAVLLGYLGTNYGGFQINQGVRSVQAELELAFWKCGLVSDANFGYPSKYSWSTSGRTDKGVHAAAQTISFKMELSSRQQQDLLTSESMSSSSSSRESEIIHPVNAHLPPDIRVLDVNRTTRNFCAKTQRDRVRYQYLIPSFVFSPELPRLLRDIAQETNGQQPLIAPLTATERQRILAAVSSYRISAQQLNTLKTALNHYVGTHSFHNFTRRCSASEMRAKRYIMEFAVADPILVSAAAAAATSTAAVPVVDDGTLYEWIPTSVTGQSFLFNQIRKMISLAMDVTRGAVPLERIAQALSTKQPEVASLESTATAATPSSNEINSSTTTKASSSLQASMSTSSGNVHQNRRRIGIAPAQGLYLDMSFYTKYNERKNQTAQQAGETPPPDLDWSESSSSSSPSSAHERWRTFRDTVIMKHVVDEEAKEGNFLQYLYTRDFMFCDGEE